MIDHCYTIVPIGTPGNIIGVDDSSCRRVKMTADDDERLNVVAPLQVKFFEYIFLRRNYSFH